MQISERDDKQRNSSVWIERPRSGGSGSYTVLTRRETIKEALHRMEMGPNKQCNVTLLVVQWENRDSKIMLVDRPLQAFR